MYCASEVTTLWHYTNMFISTSVLWRCWLVDMKDIRPVKNKWWGAGMVICLEQGADLHMAQLMPLPLTLSCFSKIQIGFTFLVPAHLGSPRKGPLNRCVCVCALRFFTLFDSEKTTPYSTSSLYGDLLRRTDLIWNRHLTNIDARRYKGLPVTE